MKTKMIRRNDGRLEILRVLSADEMHQWSRNDPLAYEKSIVWTEDISELSFVRVVSVQGARSRRGPLVCQGAGRVIGYAKLTPDAPRNEDGTTYTRRMFYIKEGDLEHPERVPADAVDPRTVLPGTAGAPPAVP